MRVLREKKDVAWALASSVKWCAYGLVVFFGNEIVCLFPSGLKACGTLEDLRYLVSSSSSPCHTPSDRGVRLSRLYQEVSS